MSHINQFYDTFTWFCVLFEALRDSPPKNKISLTHYLLVLFSFQTDFLCSVKYKRRMLVTKLFRFPLTSLYRQENTVEVNGNRNYLVSPIFHIHSLPLFLFMSLWTCLVSLYGFILSSSLFSNSSHVFRHQTRSSAITVTHFVLRMWWWVLRRAACSKSRSWHDGHDWFSSATFSCLALTQSASPTPLWTH